MNTFGTVAPLCIGVIVLTIQYGIGNAAAVTTVAPSANTAVVPADNTTLSLADLRMKIRNRISGRITNGESDIQSGSRLTDTDKKERREKRKKRKQRKKRRRKNGRKRPNVRIVPPKKMRYQSCVEWKPKTNITLNVTEKNLLVDYCDPEEASRPETRICLVEELGNATCTFVDQDSCQYKFQDLEYGNYSVMIQAVCDTCQLQAILSSRCKSVYYTYRFYVLSEHPVLPDDQPREEKSSLDGIGVDGISVEIIMAIGLGCTVFVSLLVIVVVCLRKKKPSNVRRESTEINPTLQWRHMSSGSRHSYESLNREDGDETALKTPEGLQQETTQTQIPPHTWSNGRSSPLSHTRRETPVTLTVTEAAVHSPLLQTSNYAGCSASTTALHGTSSVKGFHLLPATAVQSCITIDKYSMCADPTKPTSAATHSNESLSKLTLRECIARDNGGPGVMTKSTKPIETHKLPVIPINYKLINKVDQTLEDNKYSGAMQNPSHSQGMTKCGMDSSAPHASADDLGIEVAQQIENHLLEEDEYTGAKQNPPPYRE